MLGNSDIVSINKNKPNKILGLFAYSVPNIIVAGGAELQSRIHHFEDLYNVELIFTSPQDIRNVTNSKTMAIVIDEEKIMTNHQTFMSSLLRKYKLLPVFYISREKKRSTYYLNLYHQGLQGVIKWQDCDNQLFDLLVENLKPHPKANGHNKADQKLSEMVKSHINLLGKFKNIGVRVVDGFVFLSGQVATLFDYKKLVHNCQRIPGIKKIITKNLSLKMPKKFTPKYVENGVRAYIDSVLLDQQGNVSVLVKNNKVILKGHVKEGLSQRLIEDFASKQPGIETIDSRIRFRPTYKFAHKVRSLENRLKSIFEGLRSVTIRTNDDMVEVYGTAKSKKTKELIDKYLQQMLPIQRVVNHVVVV